MPNLNLTWPNVNNPVVASSTRSGMSGRCYLLREEVKLPKIRSSFRNPASRRIRERKGEGRHQLHQERPPLLHQHRLLYRRHCCKYRHLRVRHVWHCLSHHKYQHLSQLCLRQQTRDPSESNTSKPAFRRESIPDVDRREDRVVISAALFDALTRNANATGELRAPAPVAFQRTMPQGTNMPTVPRQGFVPVPIDTRSVPTSSVEVRNVMPQPNRYSAQTSGSFPYTQQPAISGGNGSAPRLPPFEPTLSAPSVNFRTPQRASYCKCPHRT